jgi:hypothetical protein
MIVASGIAMQFGARPLFSDVSVKFGVISTVSRSGVTLCP